MTVNCSHNIVRVVSLRRLGNQRQGNYTCTVYWDDKKPHLDRGQMESTLLIIIIIRFYYACDAYSTLFLCFCFIRVTFWHTVDFCFFFNRLATVGQVSWLTWLRYWPSSIGIISARSGRKFLDKSLQQYYTIISIWAAGTIYCTRDLWTHGISHNLNTKHWAWMINALEHKSPNFRLWAHFLRVATKMSEPKTKAERT